jgi:hypothetical protein
MGRVFQAWPDLKFLQLGDMHEEAGGFINDGRPDFDNYKPVSKPTPPRDKTLGLTGNIATFHSRTSSVFGRDISRDKWRRLGM